MAAERGETSETKTLASTSVPPPTDPYVTYQTPYPRNPSDEIHNPFIEFRRLADSAFSAFFSGLPRLLGTDKMKEAYIKEADQDFAKVFEQHAKDFERRVVEMVQARTNEAEAIRSRLEQEWQEIKNGNKSSENGKERQEKMVEDHPKQESVTRSDDVKAIREADTELDLYDGLQAYDSAMYRPKPESEEVIPQKCPWKDGRVDKKCPWEPQVAQDSNWLTGLGWDGQRRAKNIPLYVSSAVDNGGKSASKSEWQDYNDENMDPFNEDNHVIPWLKLSPYSPLTLIKDSSYMETHSPDEDKDSIQRQLSDMPWDEAFEDLMSVHKRGRLSSLMKRVVYWGGPDEWMTDMAVRGSLGPRWNQSLMVAALSSSVDANRWREFDSLKEPPSPNIEKESRCPALRDVSFARLAENRDNEEDNDYEDNMIADELSDMIERTYVPRKVDSSTSINRISRSPFGGFGPLNHALGAQGMLWPSPEAVLIALAEDERKQTELEESDGEDTTIQPPTLSSSTTTMSSSWKSGAQDGSPTATSTLTTVRTRMLPDGSIETKRVLKRRFNDGTEETNESVELKPKLTTVMRDATTQTAPDTARRQEPKPGWFWN